MDIIQIREANMLDKAKQYIIDNYEWLSSYELLVKYHIPKENLTFLIRNNEVYPLSDEIQYLSTPYLFDKNGNVLPIIKDLKEIFINKDKWGLLFWLESLNSYLGGQKPKDLLLTDVDKVIAAAKDEVNGMNHG